MLTIVANVFLQVIKDVGASNIVQIVTDNGSNFKAAGLSIEGMYPHIFWTPCVVHSLNLALKSICDPSEKSPQYDQCKWLAELVNEVQNIRNFIVNHGMASSIFKSYSSLSLLKVAETRFASSIVMCRRLKDVRVALEQMVMDADWKHYRGDGNTLAEIKAREVKKCIVDDLWWDKLDYMLKFTKPIHDMLRVADTDTPVLHLVYDMWDSMIESVKKIIFEHEMKDIITGQSDFFNAIQQILESRWTKSNTPLHCLAYSLVPKYYCNSWLQGENVEVSRIAPHEDREVSQNRNKCFKRLFQNSHDLKQVFLKYGA